ncbi:MAG: SPOR domain-containing protein [Thiobacillus sp.]|nr:SPOR domain-containing protein [Thiobacillus sp.]
MAKPASRKTGRSGGSPVFTGVLIGLIVGAILAVGVALWVTGNNPFRFATPESAPAEPAPAVSATPEAAPSFDFYKVLPGDAQGELPPSTAPAAPATRYFLQAGAFQNANDADNLKAQLAMLGVEAVIQTSEVADRGVFHRVRVGPFLALDEVDRTRSLLTQNNIPVTLVKEVPTQQETP